MLSFKSLDVAQPEFVASSIPVSNEADSVSLSIVAAGLRVVDALILVASGLLCYSLYFHDTAEISPAPYVLAIALAVILHQNVAQVAGLYRPGRILSCQLQLKWISITWGCVFVGLVMLAFFAKASGDYSRLWSLTWFATGLAMFMAARLFLQFRVRRWVAEGRLTRNIVVIGSVEHRRQVIEHLQAQTSYFNILGYFDDVSDGVHLHEVIGGVSWLGDAQDLLAFARVHRVDLVLVALPWNDEARIHDLTKQLRELPVDVRLCPESTGRGIVHGGYSDVGGLPVLNLMDRPLNEWQALAKLLEDRFLALTLLLLASPLMLAVALAIRLESPGPVFFRQKRYGFNNKVFDVFKFRTMYVDQTDERAETLTRLNDPRVTRIGRYLRKFSIDELPQLFNVLMGDMSIVGPRPHALAAKADNQLYDEVIEEYAFRHRLKPGITGWAQVNGWRGNTDTVEKLRRRVEHDLHYIENWSILLDLKIILMTSFEVLRGRNAY